MLSLSLSTKTINFYFKNKKKFKKYRPPPSKTQTKTTKKKLYQNIELVDHHATTFTGSPRPYGGGGSGAGPPNSGAETAASPFGMMYMQQHSVPSSGQNDFFGGRTQIGKAAHTQQLLSKSISLFFSKPSSSFLLNKITHVMLFCFLFLLIIFVKFSSFFYHYVIMSQTHFVSCATKYHHNCLYVASPHSLSLSVSF